MKYRPRGPQDLSNAVRWGNDGHGPSKPPAGGVCPSGGGLAISSKSMEKIAQPEATAAGDADRVAPVCRSGGGCDPYSPLDPVQTACAALNGSLVAGVVL